MVKPCPPQAVADHIEELASTDGISRDEALIRYMSSDDCLKLIADVEAGSKPIYFHDLTPTILRVYCIMHYCEKYEISLREGVRLFYGSGFNDRDRNWDLTGYRFEEGYDIMRHLVEKNGTDYRYQEIWGSL
ncbi:MAG: hypothetical protein MJZ21_04235 [archaeon]|nr:hypothetical protein [archaeon]